MDAENFTSGVIPHDNAWILTLTGDAHILVLARNKADRWDFVLRDGIAPDPVQNLCIPLDKKPDYAEAFWLMDETPGELIINENGVNLPVFIHGCVLRIKI